MNSIKILIPIHTLPDVESVTTLELNNLISFLKTKFNVEIFWFVYTATKLKQNNELDSSTIFDIHNFKNAVEVIEKADKVLSSFEPSRIPENIPSSNAAGIITSITVSISQPVRLNLLVNMSMAGSLKTVEYPQ